MAIGNAITKPIPINKLIHSYSIVCQTSYQDQFVNRLENEMAVVKGWGDLIGGVALSYFGSSHIRRAPF